MHLTAHSFVRDFCRDNFPTAPRRVVLGLFLFLPILLWQPASDAQTPVANQAGTIQQPLTLQGHYSSVTMGALSPKGDQAITTSTDQTARLWDLATGRQLRQYDGHTGPIFCLALSKNGRLLATGAQDNTIRLWDVPQSSPIIKIPAHTSAALALSISSDNRNLISADAEGNVRLIEISQIASADPATLATLKNPTEPTTRRGHAGSVTHTAWRNDGVLFATADSTGQIMLWSPFLTSRQGSLGQHVGGVTGISFSPNNQQLISTGKDGSIRTWQLPVTETQNLPSTKSPIAQICVPVNQNIGLVASADGWLRQFDLVSGTVTKEFPKLPAGITAAALQPSRGMFAAGNHSGTVDLIDFGDGKKISSFSIGKGPVVDLVFHPDNQRIACVGSDATVTQWLLSSIVSPNENATPEPEQTWPQAGSKAVTLCYSNDGSQLFAGTSDGNILQWKTSDRSLVNTFKGHSDAVAELAVTANNQLLASVGADGVLNLWQIADGHRLHSIEHPGAINSVSIRSDGQRAATASSDGVVRVWELATGALLQTFGTADTAAVQTRWLSDGKRLITGTNDGRLSIDKAAIIRSIQVSDTAIDGMTTLNSGAQAATFGSDRGVTITDINTGKAIRQLDPLPAQTTGIAARHDNQRLAIGTVNGSVAIYNPGSGQLMQTIPGVPDSQSPITCLAYSPDQKLLAVVDQQHRLRFYGPATPGQSVEPGQELFLHQQTQSSAPITSLKFTADSRGVWAAQADGQLALWAYASPIQLRQLNHSGSVYSLAFTQDGNTLVSSSADQSIRIWDPQTGQQRFQLRGHTGGVLALALSPDDSLLVSSGEDKTLRLWDVTGGRQLKQLASLNEAMYSVAVHPNGQSLAAAGADRAIHRYDLLTGSPAEKLTGHSDYIHSLTFDATGNRLLSYGYAGQLKLWKTSDGSLILEQQVGKIGNDAKFSQDGSAVLLSNGDATARWFKLPEQAK